MTEELKQVSGEAETMVDTAAMDGAVAVAVESSAGSDTVVGQVTRLINPPPVGRTDVIKLAPGERFELAANPASVSLVVDGDNLMLGFDLDDDGAPDSFVVLENLVLAAGGNNPPVLMVAGEPVGVDLLVGNALALSGPQAGGPGATLETAAGEAGGTQGTGATAYSDNLGAAIDLLVAQGVIPPVELQFGLVELEDEIVVVEEENDPPSADPVLTPASQPGAEGELPPDLTTALSNVILQSATVTVAGPNLPGSVQYVTFTLTEPTAVTIFTDGPTIDPQIYLFVDDGSLDLADLLATDDDDGSPAGSFSNSVINTGDEIGILPAGNYVVAVSDFSLSVGEAVAGLNDGTDLTGDVTVTVLAHPEQDSIVFFKQLDVDGSIGDDDGGIIADFGGADSETSLENLVFTLQSNPTFGQLILVTAGGHTSYLTPGDTFSSEDTVWWIATEDQIAAFLAQPGAPEFLPNVNFNYSVTDEAGGVATAPVVISLPPPTVPRAALGIFQDECLNEDTKGALVFSATPTDGASKISQIVISDFPTGDAADAWVVDASSVNVFGYTLGVDYTASYNAATGELTINFFTASFSLGEGVQGTVDVTPNPDSDVDETLTIEATAINGVGSATDIEDSVIMVDAIADGAEGGPGDDLDPAHLSIVATVTDEDGEVPENGTFQAGEVGTLTVHATFDDFLDGSETHTLNVNAPAGFEILGLIGDLPEGITVIASGPGFMTFDVETLNGVSLVDLNFDVQNVSAGEGDSTFTAYATVQETNTPSLIPGDMECDGGEGSNFAEVSDDAVATVAFVAPPEVSLSLYGDDDCIEEDSTDNQVNVSVDPQGDDLLTEIVITGLQADWTYDFTGLGGAGIMVDDSVAGEVTITFDTPSNGTYNGSFLATPPADSDVDHPTLEVTASVEDPIDAAVTADGNDTLDIHVDADADSGPAGTGGVDDMDDDDLSIAIDDITDGNGNSSFQAGESGTITVTSAFDDYQDGSETHEFTVTAPIGFTIDGISAPATLPDGVTFDLAGDGSSITFFLPTDSTDGLDSLTVTLDITNDSAGEGSHTFDVSAKATETLTDDEECDPSDADNIATVSSEQSVTVAGIAEPTVSINLEGDATYIKEDSEDNVVEFAAATGDGSDELTTVVITFPLEIGSDDVDFSTVAAHADVANVDIDDNGSAGPVVATITFDPGVTSFSGSFTLDAPDEDSDADLGDITIVANVQDTVDNALTDVADASLQIDVDAVLDEALDLGANSIVNETEVAGPQTINLGLAATLGSAGFTLSGAGGEDTDGSELISVVLVLDDALPVGVTLSSTDGTVTQDLVADPSGKTYVITGSDLPTAIDGLQVGLPGSFEGTISGTATVTSKEANTPPGDVVPASGAEPDVDDNEVVLSADFTVNVADGVDPTGDDLSLTVDEAAIDLEEDGDDVAPGTTFGTDAGSTAETDSGDLTINAGADPIVDISFGSTAGITIEDEDGNPIDVIWGGSGTDTLTGTLDGVAVIVLSLTGDSTAAAGGAASVTVTATLTDAFPHDFGNTGDVTIAGVAVDAEDDDGDTATSLVDVTVLDDEPNDISPEAAALGSSTGSTFTGDLDFYDNVGADKPGDVVFDPGLNGDTLLEDDGVTPVTSNGDTIILDVSGDGHTLTGYIESDDNAGYQEGEDGKIFTVVLNPDAVNEGDDEYTITLFDEIDTGGGLLFDNFGDVDSGGPKEFIALDDPRTGAEDLGEDILITASPESGLVNASTQGVGVHNQQVDAGETIRIDFVSDVVGLTDAIPGIKDDFVNLTYSSHRTVNHSGFNISQDFGLTTVTVKALDADDDKDFGGDADDVQRTVTLVTVISATGVVLLDHVAANASSGDVSVVFNGDGTVTVSGLLADYQVLVASDGGGYDALEITAVGSKFDLGGIVTSSAQAGEPVDLDFGVVATDEDGDTSSGTIQVAVLPQIDGGAGADSLVAGSNGGNIQAGDGNDTLAGGVTNDLLEGEGGADTISDGDGNDIIIGGDGADVINLANDGDTDVLAYDAASEAGDVVTGFDVGAWVLGGVGGDVIDVVDLLDAGDFTGTSLSDAMADGYATLTDNLGNAEVWVDVDGSAGGGAAVLVATLNGINVADLTDNVVVD